MRDRLLLGVARPVRGSSVKILRQNRLLYTVMHTAGLDLSTLAALVLPALLSPICLLLAPEPRAVYGPAEPCCAVHRPPCCAGRAVGAPYLICELGGRYRHRSEEHTSELQSLRHL